MQYDVGTGQVFGCGQHAAKPAGKNAIEIASRNFRDGTRLRLIGPSENSDETLFAIGREGEVEIVDRFEYGEDVYVPLRRDDPRIQSMVLPGGVKPHQPLVTIAIEIGALLRELMPLSHEQLLVLAAFVIGTWMSDGLPFAPTLGICGPYDITGALLLALSLVCRYGLAVGDITPAGLLRACSLNCPAALIDDRGLRRDTVRLLEMGGRRGVGALRKDGIFPAWCPRAIACTDLSLRREMLSDGVVIFPTGIGWPRLEAFKDPTILSWAEDLRMQLLDCDLALDRPLRPIEGEPPLGMNSREWNVFRWWGAPFLGERAFLEDLLQAIRRTAKLAPDGLPLEQHAAIVAVDFLSHIPNARTCSMRRIAESTNYILDRMDGEPSLTERKVGALLTTLGFPRRTRGGVSGSYQLEFNRFVRELIHRLISHYGGLDVDLPGSNSPDVMCPLCRKYRRVSEAELEHYEELVKSGEET